MSGRGFLFLQGWGQLIFGLCPDLSRSVPFCPPLSRGQSLQPLLLSRFSAPNFVACSLVSFGRLDTGDNLV